MTHLTSQETKSILRLSDCELMHMRVSGKLKFKKKGNAFMYELPKNSSVLEHPLGQQLLNWHKEKHRSDIVNKPNQQRSIVALEKLVTDILLPVSRKFGEIRVTYGFTSFPLKAFIAKSSPRRTAPSIDQHAAFELNSVGKPICKRGGAACDFLSEKYSSSDIVRFITQHLKFDKIYFYGSSKPLHVSVSEDSSRHLQVMQETSEGNLFPARKAFKEAAVFLAESL